MRKLIFVLFITCLANLNAQVITSGKVTYMETVKMKIDLGNMDPEMAKLIPQSQSFAREMLFDKTQSLYRNQNIDQDKEITSGSENRQMKLVFKAPESTFYTDITAKNYLHSAQIFDKTFLIVDELPKRKWQIMPDQKIILEQLCQRAISVEDSSTVTVWFAPKIPVSAGPNDLSGLPGLVLAAEIPETNRTIMATKIDALPEGFKFEKPTKGDKVNKAEFTKIREEKMKEAGAIGGKGSKIIIRTEERTGGN